MLADECRSLLAAGCSPEEIVSTLAVAGHPHSSIRRQLYREGVSPTVGTKVDCGKLVFKSRAKPVPKATSGSVRIAKKRAELANRKEEKAAADAERRVVLFHDVRGKSEGEVEAKYGKDAWATEELAYLTRVGLLTVKDGRYQHTRDRDKRGSTKRFEERKRPTVTETRGAMPRRRGQRSRNYVGVSPNAP